MKFNHTMISTCLLVGFCLLFACSKDEADVFGSVHGIVSDNNGDPIQAASVTLSPSGKTTTTGSDGRYEYAGVDAGQYKVLVVKNGYQSNSKQITVEPGKIAMGDVILTKGNSNLEVDRSNLSFGTNKDQNILSINLKNSGKESLTWTATTSAAWIKEIKPAQGSIDAGRLASLTITIDRSKLTDDTKYSSTIVITSNGGGSVEITVDVNGSSGGSSGGASVVSAGLIAYYTFDEGSVADLSPTSTNGIAVGSPSYSTDTPTQEGKSITTDNTGNQYINIPKNPFHAKKAYSISFWTKGFSDGMLFSAISSDYQVQRNFPRLISNDGKLFFYTSYDYPPKTPAFSYNTSGLSDGKWHLITLTFNRAEPTSIITPFVTKLYVDGELASSQSFQNGNNSDYVECTDIQFGGNAGRKELTAMRLSFDNIRFYDRTISDAEVKEIYAAEK